MKIVLKIILLLSLSLITLNANILNTKHNLSASGSGTVKADAEDRICVFCHIPHHAQQGTPLWNREMTTSSYTMYDSEYLRRTGYPVPTDLGSTTGTPGSQSRLCMSCHDGAVAVDQHYGGIGTDVRSGDSWGEIGVGAGGDLSNDHPIGFDYTAIAGVVDDEIRLATTPVPNPSVNTITELLWDDQWMTCASCHDVHNTDANEDYFLYGPQANSDFCLICHDK